MIYFGNSALTAIRVTRSGGRHYISKPPFNHHPRISLTCSSSGVVGRLIKALNYQRLLIIALGLLVDDAIIAVEMMVLKLEA